jgi:hypothetical protein
MLSRQIKGKRDAIPLHITYLHTITLRFTDYANNMRKT